VRKYRVAGRENNHEIVHSAETAMDCTYLLADSDEAAVAFFVMAGLVGIAIAVAGNVRRAKVAAYQARLKQLMIERGMSATEIETVVRAGPDAAAGCCGQKTVKL
jgi:hypothetical protein